MTLSHLVLIAGYLLNLVLIVFILFFEEHDANQRISWLLLVSFIPVAGPFLYILFSGNFFTRTKRMLRATKRANIYYEKMLLEQQQNLDSLIKAGGNQGLEDYGSLIHMNIGYAKSPVYGDNTVYIFKNGKEKYQSLFTELQQAKESIHLSYFIINNDETGKKLIRILTQKVKEGVAVRLLYDHLGSFLTSSRLFKPLKRVGGRVSRFFPVSLLYPFSINYRNHRKIVVIDGHVGYFGGMNIGDEYANINHARKYYWRDTHIRITGPAVQILQKQFLVDWYTSTANDTDVLEDIPESRFFPYTYQDTQPENCTTTCTHIPEDRRCEHVPIQIVTAGPDDARNDEIRDAMIRMITSAKKSVYIESPYFTPDVAFFTALKIASLSGIDVRVIIPGTWDKWYVRLAAMPYISELLSYGVKFWQYPGFIHSKMLITDGVLATIGSTNMDTRSFSLHFELNAFFYSIEFGKKCTRLFYADQKISEPFTAEWFANISIFRKAAWNFFRLFAPLM